MLRWAGLGVFVLACFWGFWSYGLFDLDEGLYAVSLMEMQQRGDWVVPTYRGEPFFEKPILFYWTAWLADLAGLDGVAALRLPGAIATIGTLAVVAAFTRGVAPVAILGVSAPFLLVGRMFMPDPFLVFGMTAALCAVFKSRDDPRWHVAAGVGLAIAVLAKGPMPLVVFGLLGIYAYWRLNWRFASPAWQLSGVAAFCAIASPWYVLAAQRSPVFVERFLLEQNLGRLAGGDSAHLGPVWMYLPLVLLGLFPFTLSLIGAWRSRRDTLDNFLWAYVIIVFVLFSLAGTKLPHYILPIFPPLAILIGRHLQHSPRVHWEYPIGVLVAGGAAMVYAAVVGLDTAHGVIAGSLGGLVAIGAAPAYWFAAHRRPAAAGFASMASATLAFLIYAPHIYHGATHEEPEAAARTAGATGLPVIEYRTGGEGEEGKTSHPSMQWIMGRNTEAIDEPGALLNRIAAQGAVVVITRGGRMDEDLARYDLPYWRDEVLYKGAEFEVVEIDSQP